MFSMQNTLLDLAACKTQQNFHYKSSLGDNEAYFPAAVILLTMYFLIPPEAFNHIINSVLIAVVPWTWNAKQTERRIWKCYLFTQQMDPQRANM